MRIERKESTEVATEIRKFDRMNTDECEAEIEKGLAKLRWTKRKQFEKDKHQNGANQDINGERERELFTILKARHLIFAT